MIRLLLIIIGLILPLAAIAQSRSFSEDNSDSVAVIIGNMNYREAPQVEYAINDAKAIKEYLVRFLHFEERNIIFRSDATRLELDRIFRPDGQLMGRVVKDRSNVFVFYSGHGVPDHAGPKPQPYLLPADASPDSPQDGYALEALYESLDRVKQKAGSERQVIVMIDACFTGETGRGKSILRISAPGFVPAAPLNGEKLIKLVATSGATPASWDDNLHLGLFTSRFLMGVAGLADPGHGVIQLSALRKYVRTAVSVEARRLGREQEPEIVEAALTLPLGEVEAVQPGMQKARDELAWRAAVEAAEASPDDFGKMRAYQDYSVQCLRNGCGHRDEAEQRLKEIRSREDAEKDRTHWAASLKARDFKGYRDNCRPPCAYRAYAQEEIDREEQNKHSKEAEEDSRHWAASFAARDFQGYINTCQSPCAYRRNAQEEIARMEETKRAKAADEDNKHWERRRAARDYRGYINNCSQPCAHRSEAEDAIKRELPVVVVTPLCDQTRLTSWLNEKGAYGGRPLDTSIYESQVNWYADGEKPLKTREEIAREEENDRKRYVVQTYTPTTLGVYKSGDQCILKQKFDSYKVRTNGKAESSAFNITYWIRTDVYGPRSITGQKIERLSR